WSVAPERATFSRNTPVPQPSSRARLPGPSAPCSMNSSARRSARRRPAGLPQNQTSSALAAIFLPCSISRCSRSSLERPAARSSGLKAGPPLGQLQLAGREPAHLQEQPAVAEARDVGLAVRALMVAHRQVRDVQVEPSRAEQQVEVPEGVEVAEVGAV